MIIVAGLPRSGTSLMMQMLSAGGMPVMVDHPDCSDADKANPRGYWECFDSLPRRGGRGDWAIKAVDSTLPLLPRSIDADFLVMRRDLREVARSMSTDLHTVRLLSASMMDWLRGQRHMIVRHRMLFTEPGFAIDRIVDFLGMPLDRDAMREAIDPNLYRHRIR